MSKSRILLLSCDIMITRYYCMVYS
uniref:Uncharacterized protein n=1 Tax=Rhizophora mucronata TaxID=61149 RepID=A0A2P2PFH5_RHIMU